MSRGLLTVMLMAFAAVATAQQIYKWTDAGGRVHYGDIPTGEPAALSPLEVDDGNVAPAFQTRQPVTGAVRIFSAAWCTVCARAKAFLERRGTPYVEYDVDKDPRRGDEFRRLGGRGVPLILVGQRRMQGFNAARLERILREAGL